MEKYRRPSSDTKPDMQGLTPVKTKITPTDAQPYRQRVIQAAETTTTVKPRTNRRLLDMSLPEGDSINRHHMTPRIRRQVRRARLWMLRGAVAVMALIIGAGGLLFSQGFLNAHKVFKGTAQQAASIQQDVDPNQLKGEGDGRINILLTGIGGPNHDGGDLTDTLMLASIDPVNHSAALLSVPRDLWVTIPGKGSMKINAAYATAKYIYMHKNNVSGSDSKAVQAGFVAIDQEIEQVLGVPVQYNVLVNFEAFRQAIDTVGGIDVTVPTDLYDPTMAWENNHNPYLARAGQQHFDGVHALIYARSRETSSDFARGERQRAVLLALKQKAVKLNIVANPAKLTKLVGAFGSNVQTDLSMSDAYRLYGIFKQIDNANIQSVSLAGATTVTSAGAGTDSLVTTGNINGQSIVMPKAGLEKYDDIQEYVRTQLQDGYIKKEQAKVLVVNGTVQGGLATGIADKLKTYGYNVVGTTSTSSQVFPSTAVVDLSHGKDKYTKHYLEQRFSTKAVTTLPDSSIQPGTADFVVILGSDQSL